MFNFYNKSDADVKRDVLNELLWDPSVNSSQVQVSASGGIVTLSGNVPHFIEKMAAEHAAERVGGVKAVADELVVRGLFEKTDEQIAQAALAAMQWNYSVPEGIQVTVEKGWITLNGEVEWDYERGAAMNAVRELIGVCGVTNAITIKAKVVSTDIKTRIEEALKRSAEGEGRKINVSVKGDTVTLSGKVHSFSEIEDARLAAWSAPGVMTVDNNLMISQ